MTSSSFRYAAVGDSTGVGVGSHGSGGYPARLLRRLHEEGQVGALHNACVSGARVADVRAHQVASALAFEPTLVTVGIGINDVWRGTDVAAYGADLERVAERLRTGSDAVILVTSLPDLSLAPVAKTVPREWYEGRIELFNAEISRVVRDFGWVQVDLYHASQRFLAGHPEFFCEDGFHPSDVGYERWAEEMWPAMQAAVRSAPRRAAARK